MTEVESLLKEMNNKAVTALLDNQQTEFNTQVENIKNLKGIISCLNHTKEAQCAEVSFTIKGIDLKVLNELCKAMKIEAYESLSGDHFNARIQFEGGSIWLESKPFEKVITYK